MGVVSRGVLVKLVGGHTAKTSVILAFSSSISLSLEVTNPIRNKANGEKCKVQERYHNLIEETAMEIIYKK